MAEVDAGLRIEVAYGGGGAVDLVTLRVPAGTTLEQAVRLSGILQRHPGIDLARNRLGVYSRFREPGEYAGDGDRIEIYDELIADPKQARRIRALTERTRKP